MSTAEADFRFACAFLTKVRTTPSGGKEEGSESTRSTCCFVVCGQPAKSLVFVGVCQPATLTNPDVVTFLELKYALRASPDSSSPSADTGSTLAPRSARLLAAFAPPPGR